MSVRLVLDVDGVLVNWNHGYRDVLAAVAERKNDVSADEEPTTWDYAQAMGYTPAQEAEAWTRINADPYFWASLDPLPGAVPFLDWLWRSVADANWCRRASHEVYFLTSRTGTRAKDQTELWLRQHGFSGIPTVLISRGEKGRIAADLHATHALDDKADNVLAMKKARSSAHVCLRSAAWNEADQDRCRHHDIEIISSLAQFQARLASEW